MNEQEYKTMDIIVTEEDTYTTNMCTDTVASSQNSAGSELRLGNTYFYFTDLTNTEYKFGYYEGETSLPSEYESLNNIPTMTIDINTKGATIKQNGGPEVAYSVNETDFVTNFDITDDDTRYRIYQKLNDEYKQKGYFEGKDVLFNFR